MGLRGRTRFTDYGFVRPIGSGSSAKHSHNPGSSGSEDGFISPPPPAAGKTDRIHCGDAASREGDPPGGNYALDRSMIWNPTSTTFGLTGRPCSRSSSICPAKRPISSRGIRTVVSEGTNSLAIS